MASATSIDSLSAKVQKIDALKNQAQNEQNQRKCLELIVHAHPLDPGIVATWHPNGGQRNGWLNLQCPFSIVFNVGFWQCHLHHPEFLMLGIPPIKMVNGGWWVYGIAIPTLGDDPQHHQRLALVATARQIDLQA